MSITLNLRYQKKETFGSEIFIAANKYDDEKEAFEKLKKMAGKIDDLKYGTFSPVYYNEEYDFCTIRFKFYKGIKLFERNIYQVNFDVKKSERDKKTYANCHIDSIKIYKKAKPVDTGIILDLGV